MPGFKISSLGIRIIYTINSQGFCQLYDIDWQLVQVVAGRWWRGGSRASFQRNPRVQENPSEIHEEIHKDSLEASTFRLEASTESFLSFPRNPTLQELPFLGLGIKRILMNPYESLWILMNPYEAPYVLNICTSSKYRYWDGGPVDRYTHIQDLHTEDWYMIRTCTSSSTELLEIFEPLFHRIRVADEKAQKSAL